MIYINYHRGFQLLACRSVLGVIQDLAILHRARLWSSSPAELKGWDVRSSQKGSENRNNPRYSFFDRNGVKKAALSVSQIGAFCLVYAEPAYIRRLCALLQSFTGVLMIPEDFYNAARRVSDGRIKYDALVEPSALFGAPDRPLCDESRDVTDWLRGRGLMTDWRRGGVPRGRAERSDF